MFRSGHARQLPQYATERYCVAYLDVLGAKKFMAENSDKFLNDLNSIYFDAVNDVTATGIVTGETVEVKIFSDNILLAIKTGDDPEEAKGKTTKILNVASNIYNNALGHGYLMRGAITIGDFFQNDVFVYGKALVDAVYMEENIAIYPRIVVNELLYKTHWRYFLPCNDGCFALNTFAFSGLPDVYKLRLLELCKRHHNEIKVMQKIMWVISCFNECHANKPGVKLQITNQEIAEAVAKSHTQQKKNQKAISFEVE